MAVETSVQNVSGNDALVNSKVLHDANVHQAAAISKPLIDPRILKEDYRNYDLVARYYNGAYRGKVWRSKAAIAEFDGADIESVLQAMRRKVDALISQNYQQWQLASPGLENFLSALNAIAHKLSNSQKAMLSAHANADNGEMSLLALKKTGNFSSTTKTMLAYAEIGSRLCDEVGYSPPRARLNQDPSLSVLIEENQASERDQEALWRMRAQLREAVLTLEW